MVGEKFMTTEQASRYLEVHKSRISQLIGNGTFRRYIKRGRVYVEREQVEAYDTIKRGIDNER